MYVFYTCRENPESYFPSPPSNFEIIKSNENCNQDQKETESNEKEKSNFFYDYK